MLVEVENVSVLNVWGESFKDRETGQDVNFYRALLMRPGESPSQLAVQEEDFEKLQGCIGMTGKAHVEIDAAPGRRVRVRLRDVV